MNIAKVVAAQILSVFLPDFFSVWAFLYASWVFSCFLTHDVNIYVHYDVNIKGMEVASLSVSTADDRVVFVLADSKSVTLSGQNI